MMVRQKAPSLKTSARLRRVILPSVVIPVNQVAEDDFDDD